MAYPNVDAALQPYRADVTARTASSETSMDAKLWLPIWAGEVIHSYDEFNMFESMVDSRTIASGASMEFPITGTVSLKPTWSAGEELIGGDSSKSTTFNVVLDKRPMAAHFELDNIDLMITQWEYRSELARQAGLRLAYTRDKQIASFIARAALNPYLTQTGNLTTDPRATAPGVDPGGGTIFSTKGGASATEGFIGEGAANSSPGDNSIKGGDGNFALYRHLGNSTSTSDQRMGAALLFLRDIEEFMVHLQEVNAPTHGTVACVNPRAFQDIRSLGVARDGANDLTGGSGRPYFGGVAEAGGLGAQLGVGLNMLSDTLVYMGVTIYKTNHLPNIDYAAPANNIGEARYNLDGQLPGSSISTVADEMGCVGLMWQREAIAGLSLQGLKVDTVDDIRRNTVFTVASMMKGTGILRPELAAICTGATVDNNDIAAAATGTNCNYETLNALRVGALGGEGTTSADWLGSVV